MMWPRDEGGAGSSELCQFVTSNSPCKSPPRRLARIEETCSSLRSDGERSRQASILHSDIVVPRVHIFCLQRALSREIARAPRTFSLELSRTSAELKLRRESRQFAQVEKAAIITADPRIVKVLNTSLEANFRSARSQGERADLGMAASQSQRSIGAPDQLRVVRQTRGNTAQGKLEPDIAGAKRNSSIQVRHHARQSLRGFCFLPTAVRRAALPRAKQPARTVARRLPAPRVYCQAAMAGWWNHRDKRRCASRGARAPESASRRWCSAAR